MIDFVTKLTKENRSGMFKYLLLLLVSTQLYAQTPINIMQSSPDVEWQKIETESFEIIFPVSLVKDAQYIASLLEYYKNIVSESYQKLPKKISLVLRPEMSQPNGFVALAPFRTEWFASHTFTPLIGSLNWYQSLAIHEYRHVVQLDYMNQGLTRFGYYLFGEEILSFLINITMPSWFFEGDAVWAETKYSNAGRGRSPRFSERLKTLIMNDHAPRYDDLLAGDYNQNLPNLYVYGYFLISRAVKLYGEDFWRKVAKFSANKPWNPWAMYNGFYAYSGVEFDTFYKETILELKKEWSLKHPNFSPLLKKKFEKIALYRKENNHQYELKINFDSHWSIYKDNKFIEEFNISPDLSKTDFKNNKFLYINHTPHLRYLFKDYADIVVFDLEKKEFNHLTKKKRFIHPSFSKDGTKIVAIGVDNSENTFIQIFTTKGEVLDKIKKPEQFQMAEAVWIDEENLAVILLNKLGQKFISNYSITNDSFSEFIGPSRNNLYQLFANDNDIYFEADDQGVVNIFKVNIESKKVSKCSDEIFGAYAPSLTNGSLYYIKTDLNGSHAIKSLKECSLISSDYLSDKSKYLGDSPSDNYLQSKPLKEIDHLKMRESQVSSKEMNSTEGLLTPYSWSFFSDRGTQLAASSQNKLGSINLAAYIGKTAEEGQPYTGINLSYQKFYPIFNLNYDFVKREDEYLNNNLDFEKTNWDESILSLGVTLPYIYQLNLYQGLHLLNISHSNIFIGNTKDDSLTHFSDEEVKVKTVSFSTSLSKGLTKKQLLPKWSYALNLTYKDIERESEQTNYFGQYQLDITMPGSNNEHGFKLSQLREWRPENKDLYHLQNNYLTNFQYTFARGYLYEFTPEFNKTTLEYHLPLSYPRRGYRDYIYVKRVSARAFFDYSTVEIDQVEKTYNSYGTELLFNTNTFRKFPITYGVRFYTKTLDNSTQGDIFLEIGL